jgi:hypothetical protein
MLSKALRLRIRRRCSEHKDGRRKGSTDERHSKATDEPGKEKVVGEEEEVEAALAITSASGKD